VTSPLLAVTLAAIASLASAPPALSQTVASRCLAIAQAAPKALPVAFFPAQEGMARRAPPGDVTIRFIGHATFLITSPGGVTIATDYTGRSGGVVPRVVTMNRAHSSHYTDFPDPAIEHVLRGWNPEGGPAEHRLEVDDVIIRNVPTDIRGWGGSIRVPDGNSIFIFETAQLCIGHLGHLHHELDGDDLAWFGQLDIVMVPVDGGYTMAQDAMVRTLEVIKARLILPMHYFGEATLSRFLAGLGETFAVEVSDSPEVTVSTATLPASPKVLVLPGY